MGRPDRAATREEIGQLLSLFAHDLRNPLAAVLANTELVAEEAALDEEAREAMDDARSALGEALRGLEQLAYVAAWLAGDGPAEGPRGDLAAAIADAVKRLGVGAQVRCPAGVVVPSARTVGRVVESLLANARDHAPGSAARVDVAVAGDRATVQIVDGGLAIRPDLAEACFGLAGQARVKSVPGARYGRCAALFACRVAIEGIGGSVTAGGEDGAAFFRVVVPVAPVEPG